MTTKGVLKVKMRFHFIVSFLVKNQCYEEIIRDLIEYLYMIFGVMKDEKLKLRDPHVSYTLGCPGDWNT
jgi:hypothetical protein